MMHIFPISLTWEMRKILNNTADEDGTPGVPRKEAHVVLNPPLVRAWRLNESHDIFPSIFITESS